MLTHSNSRGPTPRTIPVRRVEALPGHPERIPAPPSDLRAPGRNAWDAVWSELQISNADALIVANLCRLEDQAADLRAAIAEHGTLLWKTLTSAKGEIVGEESYVNPAVRELRRAGSEALAIAQQLGLTPQSRLRFGLAIVKLAEAEREPDSIDRLRSKRAKRRGEHDEVLWDRHDDRDEQ